MRPITLTSLSIVLLVSSMLCAGIAAAQSSIGETQVDAPEGFPRQPGEYRYLQYKQVTQANPGLRSQLIKQRLPIGLGGRAGKNAVLGGLANPQVIGDSVSLPTSSEQIVEPYKLSRNKSIVVKSNQVLLRDNATRQDAVLVDGPDVAELIFASKLARTAISPSGRRLVVAVLASAEEEGTTRSPHYDIYVVDLFVPMVIFPKTMNQLLSAGEYQPKLILNNIRGNAAQGAGFVPNAVAPPLMWLDEQTVLLITPNEQKSNESSEAAGDSANNNKLIALNDDGTMPSTQQLIEINVTTCVAKTVCQLKIGLAVFRPELLPVLWRRCDGAIMLRNFATDYRLDLENGEMLEDRRLSPQYELRGDRYTPSLWFGNERLCESLYFRNVGVSPDGGVIAWYARSVNAPDKTNLGNTSQYLTTLWFHSPDTGAVALAEGTFDTSGPFQSFDNPQLSGMFEWLGDD